jgi:hypothetical protein
LALDMSGDSALYRCLHGIKILKLLFEYGVPANILGKDEDTILQTALSGYHYKGRTVSTEDIVNLL